MNHVSIGPSTIAMVVAALASATAFVVAWVETGTAPAWLAGLAAGLTALMAVLRSWQAVRADESIVEIDDLVDEEPIEPDDYDLG
jgi:hypothetical protein